jgi:phosphoserine phosphatase RsbU/P
MNRVSIPVAMMAAVSFYVGVYYLWIFFGRRSDREKLSFSVLCFIVACYDIFCAGLYNSGSLAEGIFWQRLQFASLAMLSIGVLWFFYDFTRKRFNLVFYGLASFFAILLVLGLTVQNELTLSMAHPMVKHFSIAGIRIDYYEVDPGIICKIQYASMMAGFAWILYLVVRDYLKGNRRIRPLLVSLVVFFVAGVNDIMVGTNVYPFIYLIEYVYLIIIVSMAQVLINRFFDLHAEVAELNVNLERKVEERTEELHSAMEELEAVNDQLLKSNRSLEDAHRAASLDMAMAADVQAGLFPKMGPDTAEWDIAFTCRPKAGVSGDLYDFYMTEGRLRGISLFDVSGHGVSAGLLTLLAKSILGRNFSAQLDAGLGKVIKQVNADLRSEISDVDQYLSGILLRFTDDTVEYVNAGHHDLLIRRAGRAAARVRPSDREQRGTFLGLDSMEGEFDVIRFKMSENDALLLYTDGLDESVNHEKKSFGIQRILSALDDSPAGSADEILAFILNQFNEFIGENKPQDDLTVIVLKRTA